MPIQKPIEQQPRRATLLDSSHRVDYFRHEYIKAVCLEYPNLMEPMRKLANHWTAKEVVPEDLLENWALGVRLPWDSVTSSLGIMAAVNVQDFLVLEPSIPDVWTELASIPSGLQQPPHSLTMLEYLPEDQWEWFQDEEDAGRAGSDNYEFDGKRLLMRAPMYNPISMTEEDYRHKIEVYVKFQNELYARVYRVLALPRKSKLGLHAQWTVWYRIGRKSIREIADPPLEDGLPYENYAISTVSEAIQKFTTEIDATPCDANGEIQLAPVKLLGFGN